MFSSAVLDVVIGLAFVYLLLSLLCSACNEFIVKLVGLRARMLQEGIRQLLGDPQIAKKVYDHPLHQNFLQWDEREGQGLRQWLKNVTGEPTTSYIPSRTFALALFDTLVPASDKTPLTDVNSLVQLLPTSALGLQAKNALIPLLNEANRDYKQARANVETWFDQQMEHVSAVYRQQVQRIILTIALLVVIIGNIDTLVIASTFWREPAVRSAAVIAAQEYTRQNPARTMSDMSAQIEQVQTQFQKFELPIGWSFCFDCAEPMPKNFVEWFRKLIGLLLTAAAISLGAPFWFDLLKKLTGARAAVAPKSSDG